MLKPLGKVKLRSTPIGKGMILVEMPDPSTVLAWRDAANFMVLIARATTQAKLDANALRDLVLSPVLDSEPTGNGLVLFQMPKTSMRLRWQDASRWIDKIAEAIRTAKIDESKDRSMWDPERDHFRKLRG